MVYTYVNTAHAASDNDDDDPLIVSSSTLVDVIYLIFKLLWRCKVRFWIVLMSWMVLILDLRVGFLLQLIL